jgi:hypothetical protein
MVEHLSHHLKVKGSRTATAAGNGRDKKNWGISAASFCLLVAASVLDNICNFYLVKNSKITQ